MFIAVLLYTPFGKQYYDLAKTRLRGRSVMLNSIIPKGINLGPIL